MKQITIKAGLLFSVTLISVVLFSTIYFIMSKNENRKKEKDRRTVLDSVFMSTMLQTLNGNGGYPPVSPSEKVIMALQAIIAFAITTGIIIVSTNLIL